MKQEPETHPPEPPGQEETSITPPKKGTARRAFGRIDREHPISGEMSDIPGGILLRAPHPPAGATTLIVSLGLLTQPWQLALLMGAVVLLTLQALIIIGSLVLRIHCGVHLASQLRVLTGGAGRVDTHERVAFWAS